MAFETENNATLWPWLQIKEKLGLIARQERLSLNINTRRVWPSPPAPVVAVAHRATPLPSSGRSKASARALLLSAASVIFNLSPAKGLKPRKTKQTWVGH